MPPRQQTQAPRSTPPTILPFKSSLLNSRLTVSVSHFSHLFLEPKSLKASVLTMVAANLKAETKSLMEQRDAIESEMNAIIARLCQPGGPGISGNLLDSEGFPRSDIDVNAVRADRQRIYELRNDHKDITKKIDENLQVLHSARLANNTSTSKSSDPVDVHPKDTSSASNVDPVVTVPFAMVDEITDASPASEDGLQLGDQIVKFGNVESGENLLPRLASEAQTNQGHGIPVAVLRQGALFNLTVTPRQWQGRGLLGCHFRIL